MKAENQTEEYFIEEHNPILFAGYPVFFKENEFRAGKVAVRVGQIKKAVMMMPPFLWMRKRSVQSRCVIRRGFCKPGNENVAIFKLHTKNRYLGKEVVHFGLRQSFYLAG